MEDRKLPPRDFYIHLLFHILLPWLGILTLKEFFGWIFFGENFDPGWIFWRDLHVFGVKFYAVPAFNQVNGQFAGVLLLRDKQTVDLDWGLGFHDRP